MTGWAVGGTFPGMPRRPREAMGGLVYHVLNRAAGRATLLEKDAECE